VREAIRASLPANPASLSAAIREGRETFEAAGGPRAYFGWPADATADEGRATLVVLGELLAGSVAAALAPEGPA
jgi:creatinine amidohydrolase